MKHTFLLPLAAAVAAVVAAFAVSTEQTDADHSRFYFPAPAGQVWRVAAGYNTATHIDGDPYALDLVRVDAPTAGSLVLAPISGRISGTTSGSSCITLRDNHGMTVLICHVYPVAGVTSGMSVVAGQRIATVAPAGEAANNGLAHIHLAIHRNFTDGELQTAPFTGMYAIEGVELPETTSSNGYSGREFMSTNVERSGPAPTPPSSPFGSGATATPTRTATSAPSATATGVLTGASVTPNGSYVSGANSVVITGGGTASSVATRIASDSRKTVLALWILSNNRWSYYLPATPSVDGGLRTFPSSPVSAFAVLR